MKKEQYEKLLNILTSTGADFAEIYLETKKSKAIGLDNEKVEAIKRRALYDTGITPKYGQQLLTLSTCYGATKSDRIIVIGVETNQ